MKNTPLINRRQFIQLLTALSAGWPLAGCSTNESTTASAETLGRPASDTYKQLEEPWLSLAEVQQHLFPADSESPGARDINALGFLQNMLEAPDTDTDEKDFILKGVVWLNDLSNTTHQQNFIQLDTEKKESILRKIESSNAGSRWLSLMMTYLIEALLSDPVYGGNKNQKGWQWLEHIPGFPTPNTDQVYFKLSGGLDKSRRRTKA